MIDILNIFFHSLLRSVSDPYSLILGWISIRIRIQGFDYQKFKQIIFEKKNVYCFGSKTTITYP